MRARHRWRRQAFHDRRVAGLREIARPVSLKVWQGFDHVPRSQLHRKNWQRRDSPYRSRKVQNRSTRLGHLGSGNGAVPRAASANIGNGKRRSSSERPLCASPVATTFWRCSSCSSRRTRRERDIASAKRRSSASSRRPAKLTSNAMSWAPLAVSVSMRRACNARGHSVGFVGRSSASADSLSMATITTSDGGVSAPRRRNSHARSRRCCQASPNGIVARIIAKAPIASPMPAPQTAYGRWPRRLAVSLLRAAFGGLRSDKAVAI